MRTFVGLQARGWWFRGVFAAAAAVVAASCVTDSLTGSHPEASERAGLEGKETPAANSSPTAMPEELRAAYIAAVQGGASEAYAAMVLQPGRLLLENEAHRFATTLDRSGVWIASDGSPWSLSMRTAGFGCEGAVSAVSEAEPEAEGNRVRYRHEGLTAWYLNGPLGLEQGFVIAEAPACAGAKVVTIELGGDLRAELDDADGDGRGEAVRLVDAEGRAALSYADLFVKDAQGRALPAWLSAEAGQISIHVDDAGAAYPVEIDPLIATQQAKLLASDGTTDDIFGYSVALSGDTAIVGGYWEDGQGSASGAAYVFVRSGGVWTQQAKLLASDGAAGDYFGNSVALSGDTAIVGSYNDEDNGSVSGSAYVFVRGGGVWTQQAKLLPSDGAANDHFGYSVALSGDTALVGAFNDEHNGIISGSAYVFVRGVGVWTQQAKLMASDGAVYDYFGHSVALSGDTALVGAFDDDDNGSVSGSAYVFVRGGGVWTQEAKLLASDGGAGDYFGFSVALSGDTALVGAFRNDGNDTDSGSAYVFVRGGGVWTQQAKLMASDGGADDYLGHSVALSGDTAIVGAYGDDDQGSYSGSAYVYLIQKMANGDPCAIGTECASGFCVDGVCCDTACGGGAPDDCQACSAVAGAAVDGTCGALAANTECRASAGECDAAETCGGISVDCPADGSAPDGAMCTGGVCIGGACMSGSGGNGGSGGSGGAGGNGGAGGSGNNAGSGGDSTSSSTSSSSGVGGGEPRDDGGCACSAVGSTSSEPRRGAGSAALALLGLLALRRRRPARG